MKNLNFIDCLKLLMAYAVIAIHVSAITHQEWPAIFEWFIRLAVPFFFITSGYLLARKCTVLRESDCRVELHTRSRKLFRLYAKWLLVYFPIALYYFIFVSTHSFVGDVTRYVSMVIIDGESPYAWPLWFIYSMAIVFLILSFSSQLKRTVTIGMIVFSVIYLINYIDPDSLSNIAVIKTLKVFDRLTVRSLGGAIYICGGFLLFQYEKKMSKQLPMAVALLAISLILYSTGLPFSPLTGGIGLFMLGLKPELRDSTTYKKFRSASMWIYYIHMIVLFPLIVITNTCEASINPYLALAGAIVISSLLAAVLIRLERLREFSFLSSLIS